MASTVSSRTPEGVPNYCPVCRATLWIEPSHPAGDAPCPYCGTLLWFHETPTGIRFAELGANKSVWGRLVQIICMTLTVTETQITPTAALRLQNGMDWLDIVEWVMELEEGFGATIPDDEAEKIKTVEDAIAYLEKKYGSQRPGVASHRTLR